MTRTARILTRRARLVLGGAAALPAQTPPGPVPREAAFAQTVSVTGTGRVTLTPDRASSPSACRRSRRPSPPPPRRTARA